MNRLASLPVARILRIGAWLSVILYVVAFALVITSNQRISELYYLLGACLLFNLWMQAGRRIERVPPALETIEISSPELQPYESQTEYVKRRSRQANAEALANPLEQQVVVWDSLREQFDQLEREVAARENHKITQCHHGHVVPMHHAFDCSRLYRTCLHCGMILEFPYR